MVTVKSLALALAAGQLAQAQLNTAAKAAGLLYFGTAVDNGDLSDSQYLPHLETADFGQITPANSMKVCDRSCNRCFAHPGLELTYYHYYSGNPLNHLKARTLSAKVIRLLV